MDRLSYTYYPHTNQLSHIQDAATHSVQFGDLEDQPDSNYIYDATGRLIIIQEEDVRIVYDAYDKVAEVRQWSTDKLAVSFTYDDGGNRVQKRSYDAAGTLLYTEYYFRDGQGNTMGIYRQAPGDTLVPTEHTIYTTGRLGTFYTQDSSSIYEIKDHLGSVRATIAREPATPPGDTTLRVVMTFWRDYYPFGWNIPGRESDGSYRYAFQGQELDEETGWLAFQLRMYDARVGRWMSTDPKREFASPYLAMGNRPMTLVDPDGGSTKPPGTKTNSSIIPPDELVPGSVFTSGVQFRDFEPYGPHWHRGIDLAAPEGSPIRAYAEGTVAMVYKSDSYGNTVIIDHGLTNHEGREVRVMTLYAHIRDGGTQVNQGDRVVNGQQIAEVGTTGSASSGNHLHMELAILNPDATAMSMRTRDNGYQILDPMQIGDLQEFLGKPAQAPAGLDFKDGSWLDDIRHYAKVFKGGIGNLLKGFGYDEF